jgi:hypothetical protein
VSLREQDRREAARRIRGGSEGKPKGGPKDERKPVREAVRGGGKGARQAALQESVASLEPQACAGWGLSDTALTAGCSRPPRA